MEQIIQQPMHAGNVAATVLVVHVLALTSHGIALAKEKFPDSGLATSLKQADASRALLTVQKNGSARENITVHFAPRSDGEKVMNVSVEDIDADILTSFNVEEFVVNMQRESTSVTLNLEFGGLPGITSFLILLTTSTGAEIAIRPTYEVVGIAVFEKGGNSNSAINMLTGPQASSISIPVGGSITEVEARVFGGRSSSNRSDIQFNSSSPTLPWSPSLCKIDQPLQEQDINSCSAALNGNFSILKLRSLTDEASSDQIRLLHISWKGLSHSLSEFGQFSDPSVSIQIDEVALSGQTDTVAWGFLWAGVGIGLCVILALVSFAKFYVTHSDDSDSESHNMPTSDKSIPSDSGSLNEVQEEWSKAEKSFSGDDSRTALTNDVLSLDEYASYHIDLEYEDTESSKSTSSRQGHESGTSEAISSSDSQVLRTNESELHVREERDSQGCPGSRICILQNSQASQTPKGLKSRGEEGNNGTPQASSSHVYREKRTPILHSINSVAESYGTRSCEEGRLAGNLKTPKGGQEAGSLSLDAAALSPAVQECLLRPKVHEQDQQNTVVHAEESSESINPLRNSEEMFLQGISNVVTCTSNVVNSISQDHQHDTDSKSPTASDMVFLVPDSASSSSSSPSSPSSYTGSKSARTSSTSLCDSFLAQFPGQFMEYPPIGDYEFSSNTQDAEILETIDAPGLDPDLLATAESLSRSRVTFEDEPANEGETSEQGEEEQADQSPRGGPEMLRTSRIMTVLNFFRPKRRIERQRNIPAGPTEGPAIPHSQSLEESWYALSPTVALSGAQSSASSSTIIFSGSRLNDIPFANDPMEMRVREENSLFLGRPGE